MERIQIRTDTGKEIYLAVKETKQQNIVYMLYSKQLDFLYMKIPSVNTLWYGFIFAGGNMSDQFIENVYKNREFLCTTEYGEIVRRYGLLEKEDIYNA